MHDRTRVEMWISLQEGYIPVGSWSRLIIIRDSTWDYLSLIWKRLAFCYLEVKFISHLGMLVE